MTNVYVNMQIATAKSHIQSNIAYSEFKMVDSFHIEIR